MSKFVPDILESVFRPMGLVAFQSGFHQIRRFAKTHPVAASVDHKERRRVGELLLPTL